MGGFGSDSCRLFGCQRVEDVVRSQPAAFSCEYLEAQSRELNGKPDLGFQCLGVWGFGV